MRDRRRAALLRAGCDPRPAVRPGSVRSASTACVDSVMIGATDPHRDAVFVSRAEPGQRFNGRTVESYGRRRMAEFSAVAETSLIGGLQVAESFADFMAQRTAILQALATMNAQQE